MIYKIVRYKMKLGRGAVAVEALKDFVAGIAADEPETFYEAYQAEDGVSFVNMMRFPDETAEKYHQSAPHTMKFVEILYPNCEEMPVFTTLNLVKSTEK
jgi:quinol monooxygenase YgiN